MRSNGSGGDAVVVAADAEVVGASEKALRVKLDDGEARWIPRSVIHDDSEVYDEGHTGELVLMHWFAEKEGLL